MKAMTAPHPPTLRLRQVALVAADLGGAARALEEGLGLRDPYRDPGVGAFGLHNVVFEAGSDFLEVVSPVEAGTTAGRYLDRQGDGGYMAIFQLPGFDALGAARERLLAAGVRIAWETHLDDIATVHLHPKDVGGAIVSLDAADPSESWRWGGPRWVGGAPSDPHAAGGIRSITVAVDDPERTRARWVEVLGCDLDPLPSGQRVRWIEGTGGIVEVHLALGRSGEVSIGSVTVVAS